MFVFLLWFVYVGSVNFPFVVKVTHSGGLAFDPVKGWYSVFHNRRKVNILSAKKPVKMWHFGTLQKCF